MFSESQPERNARRRAADGSPPLLRPCTMQARDERAVCEAERASSRGDGATGSPCSEANCALVTAQPAACAALRLATRGVRILAQQKKVSSSISARDQR